MPYTHGVPMPHSPGCQRSDHHCVPDGMCEAYRVERNRRVRRSVPYGDCGFCVRENVPLTSHGGKKMCRSCYSRWYYRGFQGAGPGPGFSAEAEQACEYAEIITRLSAAQAAEKLGVSSRTVVRWRKHLRNGALASTP